MNELNVSFNIPFPSEREAECAYHVLRVDQEPPRSGVKKNLTHNNNSLNVSILGTDARKVRVAVTSFFENLILVTKTMEQFGPPAPSYSHF